MKPVIRFSIIFASFSLMASCSAPPNRHDYAKGAQITSPATMPIGVALKQKADYYPIDHPIDVNTPQPSLLPPGVDRDKYNKTREVESSQQMKNHSHTSRISPVRWSQSHGQSVLMIAESPKLAWKHVAEALRDSSFQVLDQDPSMLSFYILDTGVTGKQITEKTPIYRVRIESQKEKDTIVAIIGENNQPIPKSTEKRILSSIQKHLS